MIRSTDRERFLARFEMKPRWMLVEHLSGGVGELYRYLVVKSGKLGEPTNTVVYSPYMETVIPVSPEMQLYLMHRRDVVAVERQTEGNGEDASLPLQTPKRR